MAVRRSSLAAHHCHPIVLSPFQQALKSRAKQVGLSYRVVANSVVLIVILVTIGPPTKFFTKEDITDSSVVESLT